MSDDKTTPYMPDYSVTYGYKYDPELSPTDVAKRIRADIKAAKKSGRLPAGLRVSVRTSNYAGGSSIYVSIKAMPGVTLFGVHARFTLAALDVRTSLRAIGRAYNYDGSDAMVDHFNVNFYLHVDFHSSLTAERRETEQR